MRVGKLLLDTNAVVFFIRNDIEILNALKKWEEFYISITVLGELFYGAYKSAKVNQNLEVIEILKKKTFLLDCDEDTAQFFGKIKTQCQSTGRPIPDNDIWIAAIALQYKLPLITRDKHFSAIPDLEVVGW
jgi:tRNA(fMet)-specific endonuclease VapC